MKNKTSYYETQTNEEETVDTSATEETTVDSTEETVDESTTNDTVTTETAVEEDIETSANTTESEETTTDSTEKTVDTSIATDKPAETETATKETTTTETKETTKEFAGKHVILGTDSEVQKKLYKSYAVRFAFSYSTRRFCHNKNMSLINIVEAFFNNRELFIAFNTKEDLAEALSVVNGNTIINKGETMNDLAKTQFATIISRNTNWFLSHGN